MPATHFDWANYYSSVLSIAKDIFAYNADGVHGDAFGYYRETANKIRGFYWDLYGGGGNLSSFQTVPTLDPNGNSGDWETNKAALATAIRTHMRTLAVAPDTAFYTTTENAEEGLIGAFDVHHVGGIGDSPVDGDNIWGQNLWMFGVVYSRFQCMLNLALTLNETSFQDQTQQAYYAVLVNIVFHGTGGHICISNGIDDQVIFPTYPPDPTNTLYYMLITMQSLMAAMDDTPAIRTYMRTGYRMRPLPASWEGDYLESGQGMFGYAATALGSGSQDIAIVSSVWLNPAADADYASTSYCLGIVLTSVSTEAELPYNIYIDSVAYDLSPTSVKVLYLREGAVRTELARFTDILDYDHTIEFGGAAAPVYLFEIAQL